jgi:prepilin-type N-terminal cleavage/methylation domain-containing protein
MNRQGFTLIEVLVALAITGFMTTVLFTALHQISQSVSITESLMTVNEKAARLQQLFEHDLTGATLLLDNEPQKQQEQEMKTTATTEKNETKEKKIEPKEKPITKKEKKIIKKIFYSTTQGNDLGTLSFISNNPLFGFWSGQGGAFQAGKAKPCLVRITYSLENDPNMPGTFVLKRQESVPLDFEQRTGKSYEVLSGIKSLAFNYTLKTIKSGQEETKEQAQEPQKQEPAKQQTKKKTKEEITYTSNLPTWNSDETTQADTTKEKTKEKKLPIPVFIDIKVTLWDETFEHEYTYAYAIEIITDTEFIVKQRQWAFMSLFQQPEPEKEKAEQKNTPQQAPKTAIPSTGQKVGYAPWQQKSELQRKLDDLFKNVQAL